MLLVNERTSALQESEKQLRHSRDELELRVEERTSELMCSNQALEGEIDVRSAPKSSLSWPKKRPRRQAAPRVSFLPI